MSLSSSSTLAQVNAAYDDNADYAESGGGSTTKAAAFIQACRILLRRIATEAATGPERIRQDENLRAIRAELNDAKDWLALNDTTSGAGVNGGVKHLSLEGFRD